MSLLLPEARVVAVDTETTGLHPDDGGRVACVALAWFEEGAEQAELKSLALPFDQGVRDKYPNPQLGLFDQDDPNLSEQDWKQLLDWLAAPGRRLVFHNAQFDVRMLAAGTRHWEGRQLVDRVWWDTMLAARELEPLEPVGLDETAKRVGFGGKDGKREIRAWLAAQKPAFPLGRYDLAPWSLVEGYVAVDAEQTVLLARHQVRQVDAQSSESLKRRHELLRTLIKVEARGIPYDAAGSAAAAAELESRAAAIERLLPFKTKAQAERYFFDTCKVEPLRVSEKTGKPALDAELVREMVKRDIPWAAEWGQLVKLRNAVSMWYGGYSQKVGLDGRLRTEFKLTEVKTGRMSVARVNLQAIPKNDKGIEGVPTVRTFVVEPPESGKTLWNLDYTQAELRVAAKYARCRRMLELLLEGADFHSITTEAVMGVSPDDPSFKYKRDIGKRLTFGSIFQIGPEAFQEQLEVLADVHLELEECQEIIWGWRGLYPEFGRVYAKAKRYVERRGYVNLLPGTEYKRRSWFHPQRDWPNTGWSRIVQGSLAEALQLWMVAVERRHPGVQILTVHDSLLLEVEGEDEEIPADVARLGGELATELFKVPMSVEYGRWNS